MSQATLATSQSINGFELRALQELVEHVSADPDSAIAGFRVTSQWNGGARVESKVTEYELAGQKIGRRYVIRSDEPRELLGEDTAPNPQELLFAALNACMIFGYVTNAAALGITVERLSIETHGSLDIRGALAVADVPAGMTEIHYTVRLRANASPEQLEALHQRVMAHSPNRFHLAQPIRLVPRLLIEG